MIPWLLSVVMSGALAQETVDIGVLKDSDIQVVQKLLYSKSGKTELGLQLGYMPFDFATKTPNAQVSLTLHRSETLALDAVIGAGWGLTSRTYRELEGPGMASHTTPIATWARPWSAPNGPPSMASRA